MKTLIFNGSPRKNGETAYMVRILQENLGGEYRIVNAYRADIRPCIDCRWCFDHAGCAIKDEWQEILSDVEECDHIIMASPVYWTTGKGREFIRNAAASDELQQCGNCLCEPYG